MARFYADENFSYRVVERLRVLGHDVVTVQEAGERGGDDARVLTYATAAGRAVLTFDRRDFERLLRAAAAHAGIVSCTWDTPDALAARIDQSVAATDSLAGKHLRVNRPPLTRGRWTRSRVEPSTPLRRMILPESA
jgi:predicted nuclease of predicted toxin-antitoxin system